MKRGTAFAFIILAMPALLGLFKGDALAAFDFIATAAAEQPGPAQTALADLYRAAQATGQTEVVVLISSSDDATRELREAFGTAFPGIRIVTENNAGPSAQARIDGEFLSGNRKIDLLATGFEGFLPQLAKGRLTTYRPPTVDGLAARYRGADDRFHIFRTDIFPIIYNTRRIAAREALPTTFAALLDPAWAGRFAFARSASADSLVGMSLINQIERGLIDWAQVERFAAAGSRQGNLELISQTTQGRLSLALWCNGEYVHKQIVRGAPVDIHAAPFGTLFLEIGVGILNDAPHPDAARLFVAWLFTEQAQRLIARAWYPVRPGVAPPAHLPPLDPGRPTMDEFIAGVQTHRTRYESIFRD